ncbi:unnamed protein product [Caretta caretta]
MHLSLSLSLSLSHCPLQPQHFTLTHPRIPCSCWISREEASSSPLPSLAGSEALLPPHSFIDLKSVVAPVETSFLFAGLGRRHTKASMEPTQITLAIRSTLNTTCIIQQYMQHQNLAK